MVAVVLGSAVVFLDTSVVNLALPRIGEELSSDLFGTLEAQSYVAYGYFVTLSALLILAGGLTDFHGRRRMFSFGLHRVRASPRCCAASRRRSRSSSPRAFCRGRPAPSSCPDRSRSSRRASRARNGGAPSASGQGASAATTILGPFVGGLLVNTISWRMAFLVNLPLLAVAYLATSRYVPESRDPDASGHFDWLGSFVIVLAVGGLAFGTIRGQQQGWGEPIAIGSLVVGAVAAIAFPFMMLHRRDPLVPPRLFRSRNFTVTNLSTLVIYGALYVSLTFQGIFLIGTLGYNEQAAGIAGLPVVAAARALLDAVRQAGGEVRTQALHGAGPAIMALGLLWLVRMPSDSEAWVFGGGAAAVVRAARPTTSSTCSRHSSCSGAG